MATKNGINDLKTRYEELKNKEYKVGDLIFGTIQMREVICGYANCKCKKGKPHGPYTYLAFLSGRKGRAISVYLSRDDLQIIEEKLKNYQKLKEDIEDLIMIWLKIKKFERENQKKR